MQQLFDERILKQGGATPSQNRTLNDEMSIITATLARLHEIWDRRGLSPEERALRVEEFKREFIQWCRARVEREREEARLRLLGESGSVGEEADSDDEDGNRSGGDGGGDDDEMLDAPLANDDDQVDNDEEETGSSVAAAAAAA